MAGGGSGTGMADRGDFPAFRDIPRVYSAQQSRRASAARHAISRRVFHFQGGRGVIRNQPTADFVSRGTVVVLTLCRRCLGRVAPQSGRPTTRRRALLDEYPAIPRPDMGFPAKWADCPIWKEVGHAG